MLAYQHWNIFPDSPKTFLIFQKSGWMTHSLSHEWNNLFVSSAWLQSKRCYQLSVLCLVTWRLSIRGSLPLLSSSDTKNAWSGRWTNFPNEKKTLKETVVRGVKFIILSLILSHIQIFELQNSLCWISKHVVNSKFKIYYFLLSHLKLLNRLSYFLAKLQQKCFLIDC